MHTIVPIQRFFSKLKPVEREAPEWHRFNPYSSLYTLSWDDILRHRCVLLLAPGNSGKTTEMKEQVKLLSEQGKAAFFIELKHLAKDDNQL